MYHKKYRVNIGDEFLCAGNVYSIHEGVCVSVDVKTKFQELFTHFAGKQVQKMIGKRMY